MTLSTDQFKETVSQRHDDGRPFNADEVESMTSDRFRLVLDDAARVQRGKPESAMLDIQRQIGSGLYSHTAEHVGDLTHRIAEGGGAYGTEFVAPKVRQQLRGLTHPYGFEREMHEQMASNQKFQAERGGHVPTEEERQQLGQAYADEHRKVPVYNEPMWRGREAAVAVGEDRFSSAVRHLTALQGMIDEGDEAWKQRMSRSAAVRFLRGS